MKEVREEVTEESKEEESLAQCTNDKFDITGHVSSAVNKKVANAILYYIILM